MQHGGIEGMGLAGRSGNAQSAIQTQSPPMAEVLSTYSALLSELDRALDHHRDRIEPCLSQIAEQVGTEAPPRPIQGSSQVVRAIADMNNQLSGLICKLSAMTHRVEV